MSEFEGSYDSSDDFILSMRTAPDEVLYASLQRAINVGAPIAFWWLWWLAPMVRRAIEDGECLYPWTRVKNFYGPVVPARGEFADGQPGTYSYVAKARGKAWADTMAAIDRP